MKVKSSSGKHRDEFFTVVLNLLLMSLTALGLGFILINRFRGKIVFWKNRLSEDQKTIVFGLYLTFVLVQVGVLGWVSNLSTPLYIKALPLWSISNFLFLGWVYYRSDSSLDSLYSGRITTKSKLKKVKIEEDFIRNQFNRDEIVIGKSKIDGQKISISTKYRSYHSMIIGASGSGKTSLMKVLAVHSFLHGNPCLIFEPKGDDSLQEELIGLFHQLKGKDSNRKIHHYRFGSPDNSIKYNPLKYGTTSNIVETIMSSFDFSEQYYMNRSKEFLTSAVELIRSFEMVVTFERLVLLAIKDESFLSVFSKKIKNIPDELHKSELRMIFEDIKTVDKKDISGLVSQLKYFTQREIRDQFNNTDPKNDFDLRDVYNSGDVLLVDLKSQNNSDAARVMGRLFVNEILRLSNMIASGSMPVREDDCVVLMDEFASIASSKVEDVLQKCRSSRIALHLFMQNFTDFRQGKKKDELSNVLTAMLGNTHHKFVFRTMLQDDVNEICNTIGTQEVTKVSKNVEVNKYGETKETGIGQTTEANEFKVQPDLIKSLEPGNCIISAGDELVKNPDLALIWNVKKELLYHWEEDYIRRWDESYRGELGFNFPEIAVNAQ